MNFVSFQYIFLTCRNKLPYRHLVCASLKKLISSYNSSDSKIRKTVLSYSQSQIGLLQ